MEQPVAKLGVLRRPIILLLFISLWLSACNRPAQETDQDQPRADGDSEVISAEADWARRIAILRFDDAGTNNGRTHTAVLEILYALRERLETADTLELSHDLDVVRDTAERMYSSANAGARGEWQEVSRAFTAVETSLANTEEARLALNRLIVRLGG